MKLLNNSYALSAGLCLTSFVSGAFLNKTAALDNITALMVKGAQVLLGLNFTDAQVDSALNKLTSLRQNYEAIRKVELPNEVPPALSFNPIPVGFTFEKEQKPFRLGKP